MYGLYGFFFLHKIVRIVQNVRIMSKIVRISRNFTRKTFFFDFDSSKAKFCMKISLKSLVKMNKLPEKKYKESDLKKLKPTNSGFNMGVKKSSSFTCTCFKLSEMWSAFVVYLYKWKSKLFLKSSLNSHVYWEHSVDCWLLIKCKRFL